MTVINKQYSYPRVTTIRIDVQPAGENLINTPHIFYARSKYDPQLYISRGPCSQPFPSPHEVETVPYTRDKFWGPKTD
jgi:hypothetical protein